MDSQFLTNILGVASPTAGLPSPTSLLGLLFSFSALRDWLKLFVIGAFVEGCRRLAYAIYYKFIHHFYITAELHEDDGCYGPFQVILLSLYVILTFPRLDHGLAIQAEDLGYGIPSYPSPILTIIHSGGEGAPSQYQIVWLI